jgi:hypothetical protein
MQPFPSFHQGQVVWVPQGALEQGKARRVATDSYIECEVVESSGITHPSVKLNRNDTEEDVWVFKRMVDTVRPK